MAPQEAGIVMPMTAEDHHDLAVTTIKEGLHKEEKQIAVDPLSLKEAIIPLEATTLPPPLPPPKCKFLSISQPNSATSSPRFASFVSRKKPIQSLESPPRQVLQEINLQKSKSCGEGRSRALSEEFDLWLVKHDNRNQYRHGSFWKTEAIKDSPKQSTRRHTEAPKGFKCSCLYLPGLGKAKPVRAKKEGSNSTIDAVNVISRTVSMEKFECGSWASSPRAIIVPEMEGKHDSMSSYFDLPSELIKCGGGEDDAHSPVTAGFVFKKDTKGALKNGSKSNRGRKSDASPRHVRFSTSSSPVSAASSCITPRLRRAREAFNAFLEVQSA